MAATHTPKVRWSRRLLRVPVEYTDEMARLETLIQSDRVRSVLIQRLIALKGDFSVKVRFCAAVDRYSDETDREESARLCSKIVSMFLAPNSMFLITTLNAARVQAVLDGELSQLGAVKRDVLTELSQDPAVMAIVDEVEEMDEA